MPTQPEKKTFSEVLMVMGDFATILHDLDMSSKARKTAFYVSLEGEGWTQEEFSKGLLAWLVPYEVEINESP